LARTDGSRRSGRSQPTVMTKCHINLHLESLRKLGRPLRCKKQPAMKARHRRCPRPNPSWLWPGRRTRQSQRRRKSGSCSVAASPFSNGIQSCRWVTLIRVPREAAQCQSGDGVIPAYLSPAKPAGKGSTGIIPRAGFKSIPSSRGLGKLL
jgi:hypothetical protein